MTVKFWTICFLAPAVLFASQNSKNDLEEQGINWKGVIAQSSLFLGIQHGFRLATEPGTRAELKGPFWRDYGRGIRGHTGWHDGDPLYVNYVGHPMMGAVTGNIFVQNDPGGRARQFSRDRGYWSSRLRAAAFSAAYSFQFEFGPVSETSIGNVGKDGRSGVVDLVVTPVVGLAWQVGEDALDRFVVAPIERSTDNRVARLMTRSLLNPSRSMANLLRFKVPWHRDSREPGVSFSR